MVGTSVRHINNISWKSVSFFHCTCMCYIYEYIHIRIYVYESYAYLLYKKKHAIGNGNGSMRNRFLYRYSSRILFTSDFFLTRNNLRHIFFFIFETILKLHIFTWIRIMWPVDRTITCTVHTHAYDDELSHSNKQTTLIWSKSFRYPVIPKHFLFYLYKL